jgi:leucine dehydrogenase
MGTRLQESLVMEDVKVSGYERVVKVTDEAAGLRAIICIHNLRLCRVALGGTRIYPYDSFDLALTDALRLARGMTYKSAVSQCGWGGGKSVIIADNRSKPETLLKAFAEAINQLKGSYICAEDLGCSPADIGVIAKYTPYAVGVPHEKSSGDPSYYTTRGVLRGIQAACKKQLGLESLEGVSFAIQGLGSVGRKIADLLFWQGATLTVADIDGEKAREVGKLYGAKVVSPEAIYETACDVFVPCAMGAILNGQTIPLLQCKIVAGAANNQLLSEEHGAQLMKRGILYAPDFVINAGGLINVTEEAAEEGYHPARALKNVNRIYDQLMTIFDIASQNNISTHAAAERLAEYRLQYQIGRRLEPIYLHHAGHSY